MKIFDTAEILIPKNEEHEKWSVVACDQYTSQKGYWKEVEDIVEDAKSTLKLILPEVYLGEDDRIEKINKEMIDYINGDVFRTLNDSFVFVKRKQRNGAVRYGIIGQVDLEEYDFSVGSSSYIRATEGTVI